MPTSADVLKQTACDAIKARSGELVDLSLKLHRNPELKFREHQASAWLADYLRSLGFEVERPAHGLETAFRATRGKGRPAVAIVCEYDALPGLGHACGHNVIAAAGVGAAAGLARVIDDVEGSVVVIGAPGEEGGGGKILLAREGAFEHLDAAMMIHPAGQDLSTMHALAVAQIEVEYCGVAAHASAAPHLGVNALDALVVAYNAIAQLRQHIRPTERIHGIITDGGRAPNIVPDRAAGLFYVRALSESKLRDLKERVIGCFRAGAEASGAELILRSPVPDYAELLPNGPLLSAYAANLARTGRTLETAVGERSPIFGSTDMGNISKLLPSIHPMIAIAPFRVPLHSADFARYAGDESGQRGVIDGAMAMAMTSIDVLTDAELRHAMTAEFAAMADNSR